MSSLNHSSEIISSFDGTPLNLRTMGDAEGPPVLLVPSVGVRMSIWRPVLREVVKDRKVVTWDMRGLFDSGEVGPGGHSPGAHVHDAAAVLKHLEIDRFDCLAWSSGGRIALELANVFHDDVDRLTLVCAGYGHSFSGLMRFEFASLLPRVAGAARLFAGPLQVALRRFVARPEIAGLVRQSGMTAASADTASLIDLLRELADCDTATLLALYEAVSGDAAAELLEGVSADTLIIAGAEDAFTSRSVSEEMSERIPSARLVVYEEATHYLPIEYPLRLAADLREFLAPVPAATKGSDPIAPRKKPSGKTRGS